MQVSETNRVFMADYEILTNFWKHFWVATDQINVSVFTEALFCPRAGASDRPRCS